MQIFSRVVGAVETNCYLLVDSGEAVLIDPGEYSEELISTINQNHLNLKYILLTHCHFDHFLGVAQIKRLFPDTPLVIGENDASSLQSPIKSGAIAFNVPKANLPKADITVKENDEIKFGSITLRVIDTPGHTSGGVCYYTDGILISGDTLFEGSVGRTDLFGGSFDIISASIINKLYKLPDETEVFPGHGNSTEIGTERRTNHYVRG